ncbi:hypothetical protein NG895_18300 [Aeoliella sp. ICT_H6.2]|uniref:DUF6985 domain-containing protein n=1 Tax=Aeoliella straminimaris TaxID=2954799 RepID=A0A9X2FBK5_9BACT|nr:hypothetical protein [Aeoliella straminimaris]MCO6045855.1 hypothetical protein [Aeoliella straminimaris]
MATWSHADLGIFTFDEFCWTKTLTLPAFKAFKYGPGKRNAGTSRVPLQFEVEDEEELPTKPAVTIAKRVIKNQEVLPAKLLKALFRDVQGEGPASGMWWHGNVASIYEDLSLETGSLKNLKIDSPENLARLLGSPTILVHQEVYDYDNKPLAEICFDAVFEMEHGIGILTDGTKIIGTGYASDARPFNIT